MKNSCNTTFVFIDTCSLLVSCWDGDDRKSEVIVYNPDKERVFWGDAFRMLEKQGCVILPQRNYQELAKLAKNSKKDTLAKQSQYVLNNLEAMIAGGRIEIIGDANDPFADAVLLSVALKFRTQHNLIFITQDKALANDLHKIAKFESIRPREGQTISIFKIDRDGRLKKWLYHKETTAQSFKCPSKTPTVKQDNQAKTIPWWKA